MVTPDLEAITQAVVKQVPAGRSHTCAPSLRAPANPRQLTVSEPRAPVPSASMRMSPLPGSAGGPVSGSSPFPCMKGNGSAGDCSVCPVSSGHEKAPEEGGPAGSTEPVWGWQGSGPGSLLRGQGIVADNGQL